MSESAERILIVGTGSLAGAVLEALQLELPAPEVLGFLGLESEDGPVGSLIGGRPVLDVLSSIRRYADQITGVVAAVSSGASREGILAVLRREGIPVRGVVHPTATMGGDVDLASGAVIQAAAVIGRGVRVGESAVVESGVVVGSRTRLGDFVTLRAGTRVGEQVRIGERVEIGMGATVLDGLALGPEVCVAPGAVVDRDLTPGEVIPGIATPGPSRVTEGDPA